MGQNINRMNEPGMLTPVTRTAGMVGIPTYPAYDFTASALFAALTVPRNSKPSRRYRALCHLFPRAPYINRMRMKASAMAPPITRVASSGPYRRCPSLTTPATKFRMNSIGSIKSATIRKPLKSDQSDPKKKAGQHHPFFTARDLPFELEYMLNSFNSAPITTIFD